jgi:hypothetical protein
MRTKISGAIALKLHSELRLKQLGHTKKNRWPNTKREREKERERERERESEREREREREKESEREQHLLSLTAPPTNQKVREEGTFGYRKIVSHVCLARFFTHPSFSLASCAIFFFPPQSISSPLLSFSSAPPANLSLACTFFRGGGKKMENTKYDDGPYQRKMIITVYLLCPAWSLRR